MGPYPLEEEVDADLVNAGKETVTVLPGGAFFDCAESFGMVRAGRIDLTVLGAMDLVASTRSIIVAMQHTDPSGKSKLLPSCTLPLTVLACVKKIVTDLPVLTPTPGGFRLLERAPGVTIDEIRDKTAGRLLIGGPIPEMKL